MMNSFFKNKGISLSLVIIFLLVICYGCINEREDKIVKTGYEVVDSQGTVVKILDKPKRIVTLSMHTDIIALGMVTTDKMAAINALLDDPYSSNIVEKAKKIPVKIKNPSAEEIFALKPDLIIASAWTPADIIATLRDLGFPVLVTPKVADLSDIKTTIKLISTAIDEEEKGKSIIKKMDEELADIKIKLDKVPNDKRKKVALISLMTTYGGSGCTYDDMCKYAGVTNGISAVGITNGQILTKEMLVKINPDILLLSSYQDHGAYDVTEFNNEYVKDPSLQTINAVKNKKLCYPREGYLYNASQDFVYGVKEIAFIAYGEDFMQPANCHISVSGE